MTYSVQDAREHLGEILEKVRSGEKVMISEEGQDVAEIRAVGATREPISVEEALRQLEEEGIISAASGKRPSLDEILRELEEAWSISPPKPGGLARFLESRG
jgi:antitoxin (DNA-binding transcriptional repressor) of toxin-antitoxin stability system